jgi:hypothetical protein
MRASNRKLDCFEVPTTYVESCDAEFSNGAKTGAVRAGDPRLDAIINAWPGLTEEVRDAIACEALGRCTN